MSAIHFISGLPRSGSTLLSAVLRQNPRFHAGMSSPLSGLFGALIDEMSARNEYSVFLDDEKRERILRTLFHSYYADNPAEVIFDTSRDWCGKMQVIARLFPDAKVVACVRDLPWVVDSIESLVQRNVFSPSSMFNYTSGGTVYTRANQVVSASGLVGGPFDLLKQACYGGHANRLLLVQYESMTADPAATTSAIYRFLGEPEFDHDFNNVVFDGDEFDRRAGAPGLHTVRGAIKVRTRPSLLPPDLFNRFLHDAFWRDPERIPPNVQVV